MYDVLNAGSLMQLFWFRYLLVLISFPEWSQTAYKMHCCRCTCYWSYKSPRCTALLCREYNWMCSPGTDHCMDKSDSSLWSPRHSPLSISQCELPQGCEEITFTKIMCNSFPTCSLHQLEHMLELLLIHLGFSLEWQPLWFSSQLMQEEGHQQR